MNAQIPGGHLAYPWFYSLHRILTFARRLRLGFQQYAAESESNSNANSYAITFSESCSIAQPDSRCRFRRIPGDVVFR
jgi:hypothetical protein